MKQQELIDNSDNEYGWSTQKVSNWTDKRRILISSSRGIKNNENQLLKNWAKLLAHSKKEAKIEKKELVHQLADCCEGNSCEFFMYYEQKRDDLFMYMGSYPDGPTFKFLVSNFASAENHKFLGNCLRHSRPILSFGSAFGSDQPKLKLLRQLFVGIFSVPKNHPKSQPFIDKTITFDYINEMIEIRVFQIIQPETINSEIELVEIGPRMSLEIIQIFDGFLSGEIMINNKNFNSRNTTRKEIQTKAMHKNIVKQKKLKHKKELWQERLNNKEKTTKDLMFE